MAKKFKILQAASKIPADALTKYKEFRAGDRKITRSVNPALGPQKWIFLYPFGLEAAAANHTAVLVSARSFNKRGDLLDTADAILNIAEAGADASATNNPALTPAKAIISDRGEKKATDPISGVTGLSYTAYNNVSYTLPFGQNATGISYYKAVEKEIMEAVELKDKSNSVTFKPERWRKV